MTQLDPLHDYRDWGSLCVISPHLDDAVLSCGHLLACCPGAVIITVLAGDAPSASLQTQWDRLSGYENAGAAMRGRRAEDRAAAKILEADVRHLSFLDGQYGPPAAIRDIGEALRETLASLRIDSLLLPLGLHHSDHLHVAQACRALAVDRATDRATDGTLPRCIAYEEVPYRRIGTSIQTALARLLDDGISAVPVHWKVPPSMREQAAQRKQLALAAYESQMRSLPQDWLADANRTETFWELRPSRLAANAGKIGSK